MRRTTTKLTLLGVALATGLASQAAVAVITVTGSLLCPINRQERIRKLDEMTDVGFAFEAMDLGQVHVVIELIDAIAVKPIKFRVIVRSDCNDGRMADRMKTVKLRKGESRVVVTFSGVPPGNCQGGFAVVFYIGKSPSIWGKRIRVGDVSRDSFLSLALHIQDKSKCKPRDEVCSDYRECCSMSCVSDAKADPDVPFTCFGIS